MVQTELRLVVSNDIKVCSACKVPKLSTEFHRRRDRNGDWALQSHCKHCVVENMRQRRVRPEGEALAAEGTDGGMTYKQVADVMGLTPEGVRQIEIRALRKLRANAKIMRAIRQMLDGRD